MNEQWLKCKAWFANLTSKEKQAVLLGGSLLGLVIVYVGIVSPILNHISSLRQRIVSEQKNLLWMQTADKAIRKLESQSPLKNTTVSPVVLLSFVQKKIASTGLTNNLTQLKQITNNAIAVHFQKVSFDKLMVLLITIVKEQNVSLSQMSVVADSTLGIVNAELVLKLD